MNEITDLSFSKDLIVSIGEMGGALFFGLIIGIISVLKKRSILSVLKSKNENKIIQGHSRVHETLTELRVLIHASRVIVFQYHNGGKFADGTSIKRFSVTHESCSTGVSSVILESQDVLVTRYMELIDILEKKDNKIISVFDLPDCLLRSAMEINNVEYFSVSKLKCNDSLTPMGFLCCHWCDGDTIKKLRSHGFSDFTLEEVIENSVKNINNHLLHSHK